MKYGITFIAVALSFSTFAFGETDCSTWTGLNACLTATNPSTADSVNNCISLESTCTAQAATQENQSLITSLQTAETNQVQTQYTNDVNQVNSLVTSVCGTDTSCESYLMSGGFLSYLTSLQAEETAEIQQINTQFAALNAAATASSTSSSGLIPQTNAAIFNTLLSQYYGPFYFLSGL